MLSNISHHFAIFTTLPGCTKRGQNIKMRLVDHPVTSENMLPATSQPAGGTSSSKRTAMALHLQISGRMLSDQVIE